MDFEDLEQEQPKRGRKPKVESSAMVKITKGSVSVFRKESDLEKYLEDGWTVAE